MSGPPRRRTGAVAGWGAAAGPEPVAGRLRGGGAGSGAGAGSAGGDGGLGEGELGDGCGLGGPELEAGGYGGSHGAGRVRGAAAARCVQPERVGAAWGGEQAQGERELAARVGGGAAAGGLAQAAATATVADGRRGVGGLVG